MIYWIYSRFLYIISRIKYPIGKVTGYRDCQGEPLCIGDKVAVKTDYVTKEGILLHSPINDDYEIYFMYSRWCRGGEYNPYSYGKSYNLDSIETKDILKL